MEALWIAFFTGLTTGGLSCMAVQGGLITGSLAYQVEKDIARNGNSAKPRLVLPILLFLIAKLVAYTALGFLLGLLGSAFSLSPTAKGILQIAIAIFMLGNALRLLNVHPIFRYFSFEPPSFITRYIRRRSKKSTGGDMLTPLTLGAMTILIPCGITQAMMAVAISTGSAFSGAATMFAFILGTSPVFFALTYLATRLGSLTEKYFFRIVAVVLLILAFVGIDQGMNLLGSTWTLRSIPMSAMATFNGILHPGQSDNPPPATSSLKNDLQLTVSNNGYFPEKLYAPANQPLKLHLVSKDVTSCALDFTIPVYNVDVLLEETGEKVVELPPLKAGSKLHFSCSMGMYVGDIIAVSGE